MYNLRRTVYLAPTRPSFHTKNNILCNMFDALCSSDASGNKPRSPTAPCRQLRQQQRIGVNSYKAKGFVQSTEIPVRDRKINAWAFTLLFYFSNLTPFLYFIFTSRGKDKTQSTSPIPFLFIRFPVKFYRPNAPQSISGGVLSTVSALRSGGEKSLQTEQIKDLAPRRDYRRRLYNWWRIGL